MNKVKTDLKDGHLGSVLGPIAKAIFRGNTDKASAAYPPRTDDPQHSVFVALPKRRNPEFAMEPGHTEIYSKAVYCEKPAAYHSRTGKAAGNNTYKTSRWLIWRVMPLVILVATIFAAIGMLQLLVEGVHMQEYYPAGYLKTQSWRGGAGPSPMDAMKTEYQNAITKEMVHAVDTGTAKETAKKEKKRKAKTDSRITLSSSRYKSSKNEGLHNLKIKVFNGTPNVLDRVTVEVDFLGKKGKLLNTETFSTREVGPHKEKMISIPEGRPGLKVQYRISEVRSKRHTTQLHHL